MTTEQGIDELNALIATARDGEEGYRHAAAHVADAHLQTVFAETAKERAGFVRELEAEIRRLGGEPAHTGTLSAAVHRGWLDVKSALTGGDSAAVVAACETGDDAAQAAYERVVDSPISGQTRTLVESQWRKIREAHARLLNLKKVDKD